MARYWATWAAFGAIAIVAVLFLNFGTGIARATTTYSVAVTESGLPTGTTWSATFNSVTNSGKGATLTFSGLSAGSYCWSVLDPVTVTATTTRYVPYAYSGCITVPNQLTVTDVYSKQYYVTFGVTPSSSGSTTPSTNWYTAGSTLPIAASANPGYSFSKWSVSAPAALPLGNTTYASTEMTVQAAGTVTAHFNVGKATPSFLEVGLPASTSWAVVFGGISHLGSTATLSVGSVATASYSWSIAPVSAGTGIQYAPSPSSGSMNVPYQTTQEVVFVKQFSVTIATNPASSGSTYPSGTAYYTNGTNLPITASDASTWAFSGWSGAPAANFGIMSKTTAGTNVTIHGPGTLTAKFVTGTPCTTCTVTFREVGLPAGTGWGITWGGALTATNSTSLVFSGQTAAQSWSAFSGIGSGQYGVEYVPTSYTASSYWYLGSTNSYTIVYTEWCYVGLTITPYYAGSTTVSAGWYPVGSTNAASAIGTSTTKFASWSSSGANVTVSSPSKSSMAFTVLGPATLTVAFAPTVHTVHFLEYGLVAGTTWGAALGSQSFWSNSPWINVTGVPDGSYSWSVASAISAGAGVEWMAPTYYGSMSVPGQTVQAVVYVPAYQVTVQAGGTAGGSTSPSGTTWYPNGTVLPLMASNGTSVTFTSWGATVVSGTITVSSTTSASTFVTIKGTGTITGTFA